ncbi:MAG: Sua5/YciO/YrdC/YwlC family protein [Pseudomonadales bacterium]|nr:Sua5/YciO/YrdC/YwlC family protein [Gammaproteobacteria bacterium]
MTAPGPQQLDRAVSVLRAGGVIACATEGVWGLACDPGNEAAVRRILVLKGREADKGLILVAGGLAQVESCLRHVPADRLAEIHDSWPGPVTWIVPHHGELPVWITGAHPGVAIRVSDHLQLRALCLGFGGAIVSTSANPQGMAPARSAQTVRRYFGDRIDYLLPGALGGRRKPSEIRDALSGRILRPG